MSPSKTCISKKVRRRIGEGWALAYQPDTRPYRRPRWQQPGKYFDVTVIVITVIVGLLAIL